MENIYGYEFYCYDIIMKNCIFDLFLFFLIVLFGRAIFLSIYDIFLSKFIAEFFIQA
jgi:hypothetical protein